MMSRTGSWIEHLTNATEARSLFPRDQLALSGLLLLGLEYVPGNKLRVTLRVDHLPEDAPQRWRDRGAIAVEICLDVGVSALNMRIAKEFDEMPLLDVAIDENRLRVVAQDAEGDFEIEARTFYIRLEAKPSMQQ
jgi:hypothetical protein